MKKLFIIAALTLSTQAALANSAEQFKGLTITPVEQLTLAQSEVIVNDKTFKTNGTKTVVPGLDVFDVSGLNAYTVTGEIIVKLSGDVDFEQFNKDNDLIIKQAFKSYYILKSQSQRDLLPLVDALKKLEGVSSVTLELVDKGVIEK
ncbi:hypothetical protein [Pseudoalteromonas sp. MMG024]|uniref:hypothetical protein n=1 Tax=Pseudoalteromonas sp. MMG024 TaxID=2909980 RepID=UPI001F327C62|nr:hypothetical protein [Pseudoalteromonas sp. MMG024]MCF6457190.1 hypothetical protein [Pseudoalteromonas sp. MMG024]